jgi:hypothetical protein
MAGGWIKLHKEELRNLYFSPNTIRMMKSWVMKLTGNIARMEWRAVRTGFWSEIVKERGQQEGLDVDGWVSNGS